MALLTGCVQDLVFPDINRDTADVLLANGCEVDTPRIAACCGSLHAHNGEMELARTLARRLIDLVPPERYDAIITQRRRLRLASPALRPLLADDPAYARTRARPGIASCGTSRSGWWRSAAGRPRESPTIRPVAITYHESCHLVHGQKISRQPRALLRLLPGVTLTELPESSWCCGSAGIYALTQPEQADALLKRKVATHRHDRSADRRDRQSRLPSADRARSEGVRRDTGAGRAPGVAAGEGVSAGASAVSRPVPSAVPSSDS